MRDFAQDIRLPDAPVIAPLSPEGPRAEGLVVARSGVRLLDEVSLVLPPAGISVVMGPNGAGKSLLLRVIAGLLAPDAGTATRTGTSSFVFQRPVLLRRSVAANMDFVLGRAPDREARREAALARVDLSDKARQPARRLSGGEAQRLALARALVTAPTTLFLDEPTASLDPASALAIEEILTETRAAGVKIVLVTHDRAQARRVADDVVFLHRGRVQEHSPADAFFAAPDSAPARDFLAGRIVVS